MLPLLIFQILVYLVPVILSLVPENEHPAPQIRFSCASSGAIATLSSSYTGIPWKIPTYSTTQLLIQGRTAFCPSLIFDASSSFIDRKYAQTFGMDFEATP